MKCLGWIAIIANVLGVVCTHSVYAETNISPTWLADYRVRTGGTSVRSFNTSYLSNIHSKAPETEIQTFQAWLMEPGQASAWRQEYELLNRDIEVRRRAGISDPWAEGAHSGRMAGFSNGVLGSLEQKTI